jgi:hypothetical protein
MAREVTIKVRLTPAELDLIKSYANTHERSVSALVRDGVAAIVHSKAILDPKEVEALAHLRNEVRRVGINLNALLRSAHFEQHGMRNSGPRLTDYEALAIDLRAAFDRLTTVTRALPI